MDRRLLLGVVEHGLEEAAQRSLILLGNAAILLNNLHFLGADSLSQEASPSQDEHYINAQCGNRIEVSGIRMPGPALITSLRIAIHPSDLCQILLLEVQSDPFFAQPIPDRSFRL